ncbi:hypothetical protein, partial [Actinomadura roseirufa]|uniref:hypothetical protein n=1 Tax=Actinomadura roseirufa TaxID=2094049 RepID=UPI001A955E9D
MTEQPGDLLDEAAKLFDTLRRRLGGSGGGPGDAPGPRRTTRDDAHDPDDADDAADVWSRATAEPPRIATGAPECRDCPVCRAIAIGREAGGDVRRHV